MADPIIQIPYKIIPLDEDAPLRLRKNFDEIEHLLGMLQLYMKRTGKPTITNSTYFMDKAIRAGLDENKGRIDLIEFESGRYIYANNYRLDLTTEANPTLVNKSFSLGVNNPSASDTQSPTGNDSISTTVSFVLFNANYSENKTLSVGLFLDYQIT